MKRIRFYQVDVFTSTPFLGNPVAVVQSVADLQSEKMQQIAREMNQSEAVFFLPCPEGDADYVARFFTPTREVPFAGHSLLGTAFVVAEQKQQAGPITLGIKTAKSTISVEVAHENDTLARATMELRSPTPCYEVQKIPEIALALKLGDGEVGFAGAPLEVVKAGLHQLLVPVASLEALYRIHPEPHELSEICREVGADTVYAFALVADGHVEARLFAPLLGVPEDPVTGSAAGALGAYLLWHKLVGGSPVQVEIRQGSCVNRPGRARVEAIEEAGKTRVKVSGHVIKVAEGEFFV